ncbi:MAG: hypothetical protein J3T61_10425 [Candidatus Brocadiales bacterium]|nr:hypothetical protein [Candidatus Bathyanammoxibius sp.]
MAKAKYKKQLCCDKVVTIGHLKSYMSKKQLRTIAGHHEITIDRDDVFTEVYADKFYMEFLGAKSVRSIDCSDYEDCDIVHDMNQPIPAEYSKQFDVLIDGGSLEHIFNIPVAVANYMNMVKEGGSIFIWSMANNHLGHGFYQFSPEIFYRIFQPENGFVINEMVLVKHPFPGAELSNRVKTYSVADPAELKRRVELVSRSPISIMVHAIRTSTVPIFNNYPIQSDYVLAHAGHDQDKNTSNEVAVPPKRNVAKSMIKKFMPLRCQHYLLGKYQLWLNSFSNKRFFKKWDSHS